jgi:dihydrodipicolinate synthase/N-acetylneuraminate lyase
VTTLRPPFSGVLAATLTPLSDDGERVDLDPIAPMLDFLAGGGCAGALALGTTGEGILLGVDERRQVAEAFVQAAGDRLKVVVHCGAQTTRDTVTLAEHAAQIGAAGVAVIGPPYFPLDDGAMLAHFAAAARACAPLPFFVYEFAARSGYAVPLHVIDDLRSRADNVIGLKVSDTPWERFELYMRDDLTIFAGPEGLISQAMARGAVGSVSALASTFPELVVEAVRSGTLEASRQCAETRDRVQQYPFHAAMKRILARRGVPIGSGVRGPLRPLTSDEARQVDQLADELLGAGAGAISAAR